MATSNANYNTPGKLNNIGEWLLPLLQQISMLYPLGNVGVITLTSCADDDVEEFLGLKRQLSFLQECGISDENIYIFESIGEVCERIRDGLSYLNLSGIVKLEKRKLYDGVCAILTDNPTQRFIILADKTSMYDPQIHNRYIDLFTQFPDQIIALFLNVYASRRPKVWVAGGKQALITHIMDNDLNYEMTAYWGNRSTMHHYCITTFKLEEPIKTELIESTKPKSSIFKQLTGINPMPFQKEIPVRHLDGTSPYETFTFDDPETADRVLTKVYFKQQVMANGKIKPVPMCIKTHRKISISTELNIPKKTPRFHNIDPHDYRKEVYNMPETRGVIAGALTSSQPTTIEYNNDTPSILEVTIGLIMKFEKCSVLEALKINERLHQQAM